MAAAGRDLWRTCWCLYRKSVAFNLKPRGTRTCFAVPGIPEEESFEEMFRNSDFVKMGRPQGKSVAGRITHVVEHEDTVDLYVDFGWKFHAVFTKAGQQRRLYKVDDLVKIKLKALEATGHFLGQNRRVTLCEADGHLEGKIDPDMTCGVFQKDHSSD